MRLSARRLTCQAAARSVSSRSSVIRVDAQRGHQEPARGADMLVLEVPEAESGVERARRRDDPGAGRQRAPGPCTALARVELPSAGMAGVTAHGLVAM